MSWGAYDFPEEFEEILTELSLEGMIRYRNPHGSAKGEDTSVGKRIKRFSPQKKRLLVMAIIFWLENDGQLRTEYNDSPLEKAERIHSRLMNQDTPNNPRDGLVCNALGTLLWHNRDSIWPWTKPIPFEHDDIIKLLHWSTHYPRAHGYYSELITSIVENYLLDENLTNTLQCHILELASVLDILNMYGNSQNRLRSLVNYQPAPYPFVEGEAWSDALVHSLKAMDSEHQSQWLGFLEVCTRAKASKPTKKWKDDANAFVEKIGRVEYIKYVQEWLAVFHQPRPDPNILWERQPSTINLIIAEKNQIILKGLIWLCESEEDPDIARLLSHVAISSYRSLLGRGPRCAKVGNACVWVLGEMPGRESIAQLTILQSRVKSKSAQKEIEKALIKAAEREGLERSEIEEMVIPSYGMTEVGVRREVFGDFVAELMVTGTTKTELRWGKADGKTQKSVPKLVKENFADELKDLKQAAKDIKKMLPVHRDRIDRIFLAQKEWDFATWRERYLDHPLIGTLARRIIWQFDAADRSASGIWQAEQIVNQNGKPLAWLDDSTTVKLWHPINESTDDVLAWRSWLIENQVQQPFKQAYREIYVLTDAERNTNVYSNRFAAHILKQHQFNSLCGVRGWENQLRLMVDATYEPATRILPEWGMRAEFWIEGVEAGGFGHSYVFNCITTDQVRFYAAGTAYNYSFAGDNRYHSSAVEEVPDPIPLEEVPPLVLTEVLRDVDLFVGVASIGNDPNWLDSGEAVPLNAYWQSYAFGDLTESAETRKELLIQILPSLKIRDRTELTDKYLTVRGDIRTYKIHLGSGNILMEPNGQYLCIVPSQGAARGKVDKLFLPFEGDQVLAIILSKAFLLADDTKIKDRTILSQIKQ